MPKSKITIQKSAPQGTRITPAAPVDTRTEFHCCRCTRTFKKQKGNFSTSQSPLYRGNNGYLPVCYTCMDEIYQHYRETLGTSKAAMRRICMKFDIYWHDSVYQALAETPGSRSRVRAYISKTNMSRFLGKTYDDTLDEESGVLPLPPASAVEESEIPDCEHIDILTIEDIDPSIIEFWGGGYTPEVYIDLDRRFQHWTTGNVAYAHDDPAQESLLKQLCILERRIENAGISGAKVSDDMNAFNTLLGSANLKPSQKKADTQVVDETPLGVWAQRWENEKPIPEPDPAFADVDGIARYISIWFLGHLCKMLKIKNSYSRLYEAEIARLRVERPEYDGDDDEEFFQDIFESGGGD